MKTVDILVTMTYDDDVISETAVSALIAAVGHDLYAVPDVTYVHSREITGIRD